MWMGSVVDQVGGEQASEVVRCEAAVGEVGVMLGDLAQVRRSSRDGAGRDLVALTDVALEQERLWIAGDAFARCRSGSTAARAPVAGESPQNAGDDVEQFRRHGDHAFAIGLRWCDDQQCDDFPLGRWYCRMLSWDSSRELLDPQPGVSQRLDDGPLPEGGVLGEGGVDELAGGLLAHAARCPSVAALAGALSWQ